MLQSAYKLRENGRKHCSLALRAQTILITHFSEWGACVNIAILYIYFLNFLRLSKMETRGLLVTTGNYEKVHLGSCFTSRLTKYSWTIPKSKYGGEFFSETVRPLRYVPYYLYNTTYLLISNQLWTVFSMMMINQFVWSTSTTLSTLVERYGFHSNSYSQALLVVSQNVSSEELSHLSQLIYDELAFDLTWIHIVARKTNRWLTLLLFTRATTW